MAWSGFGPQLLVTGLQTSTITDIAVIRHLHVRIAAAAVSTTTSHRAVVDSKLHPAAHRTVTTCWYFVEQNLVETGAVASADSLLYYVLLQLLGNITHDKPHVKTCRHPQNRKYVTYRNAVRGGPSHSHCHGEHAQNCGEIQPCGLMISCKHRPTTYRKRSEHTRSSHSQYFAD